MYFHCAAACGLCQVVYLHGNETRQQVGEANAAGCVRSLAGCAQQGHGRCLGAAGGMLASFLLRCSSSGPWHPHASPAPAAGGCPRRAHAGCGVRHSRPGHANRGCGVHRHPNWVPPGRQRTGAGTALLAGQGKMLCRLALGHEEQGMRHSVRATQQHSAPAPNRAQAYEWYQEDLVGWGWRARCAWLQQFSAQLLHLCGRVRGMQESLHALHRRHHRNPLLWLHTHACPCRSALLAAASSGSISSLQPSCTRGTTATGARWRCAAPAAPHCAVLPALAGAFLHMQMHSRPNALAERRRGAGGAAVSAAVWPATAPPTPCALAVRAPHPHRSSPLPRFADVQPVAQGPTDRLR